jgi:hypothetical protein
MSNASFASAWAREPESDGVGLDLEPYNIMGGHEAD